MQRMQLRKRWQRIAADAADATEEDMTAKAANAAKGEIAAEALSKGGDCSRGSKGRDDDRGS